MSEPINKKDIIVGDPFSEIAKDIDVAYSELTKFDTELKKVSASLTTLSKSAKTTIEGINSITEAEKRSKKVVDEKLANDKLIAKVRLEQIRIEKAREKSIDDFNKKELQAQRIKEKTLAQMQRESERAKELNRPYNKLSARLNALRKDYKDLAVAGNENSTSARKMKKEIDSLDKTLKNVDGSVGQHTKKVGEYENAFRGLSNVMGTFGLSLGVGFIGREFVETLKEYEDAVASFRTIVSDATDVEFAKYKEEINSVAKETKKSTTDIAESFEKIAGLNSEFAETSEGLGLVSEAVSTLSKASKDEMEPSAENLVGIMNQFDLTANQANRTINVLAAGQAVGASSITQSAEAYKNFGAVAKGANITLEESQALIQVLGKSSIFGAEAGTKLRGVTLQLQKANLGYASGQFDINDALTEFNKKLDSKTSASEKDAYATKIFGAENITAGKIISSNIPLFDKFTEAVTGTSEAQKAAEINTNTLSNRWTEFKDSITTMITSNTSATNSLNGVKDVLKLITENLPTIISLVTKLGIAFVTFKTFVAVANTDFKALLQNFTKLKTETAQGEKGVSGFGKALKGVGWTVAIGLAIELVHQFYELATGAEQVREQMEAIEKANKRGSKEGERLVQEKRKEIESYKALQEELLSTGEIDQKEYNKRIARREKDFQDRLKQDIRLANESKKRAKEEAQNIASALKAYDEYEQGSSKVTERQFRQSVELIESLGGTDKAHRQIDFLKQRISEENAMLTTLNGSLKTSSSETRGLTLQNNQLTSSTKTTKKEIEDYTQKVKELNDASINDEQSRQETQLKTKLQSDLQAIKANGIMAGEFRKALEDEYNTAIIKLQKEFNTKREEANKAYLDDIEEQQKINQEKAEALEKLNYDKEIEGIELVSKRKELAWISSDMTEEEIEEERLKRRKQVLQETIDAGETYNQKVIDAQIELAQIERDIDKKADQEKIERAKEVADKLNEIQEGISQALQEQIDKRIEFSKDEEDQAKSRQSFYEDLAKNGNIKAEQSIAEQIELQREAQQEQARLEKQKQQIEMISAGLSTFNASIQSGKSPAGALAETVLSTSALVGILKNINFYAKGTDNAPQGLAVVDEKGAEIITDKHGKIKEIGSGDGARFVNLDRGDKVITATKTAQYFDNLKTASAPKDIAGNSFDLMQINETLKRIESLNKTSKSTVDWGGISGGVANIIEKKTIGRSRTTNLFRS